MTTSELLIKLWPIGMAILAGAFWMGVLDFRVRHNTAKNKEQDRRIERNTDKMQKMEVEQAGWKSVLENINRRLTHIDKKLDDRQD